MNKNIYTQAIKMCLDQISITNKLIRIPINRAPIGRPLPVLVLTRKVQIVAFCTAICGSFSCRISSLQSGRQEL